MDIGPDDLVRCRRGAGDAALDLRRGRCARVMVEERLRRIVARLHFDCRPVDCLARRAAAACRSSSRSERKAQALKVAERPIAGASPTRPAGQFALADMNQAAQGTCRWSAPPRRSGKPAAPSLKRTPATRPLRDDRSSASPSTTVEIGGIRGSRAAWRPHKACGPPERAVRAPPALAAIQHRGTGCRPASATSAHQPVQRIDLAHQMALAEAADGGIAGHCADRRKAVGHQRACSRPSARPPPQPRSRHGRRRSDDDVEGIRTCKHGATSIAE